MPDDYNDDATGPQNRVDHGQLKQFKQRYVRLEEEKKDSAEQQKELLAEMKGAGYNTAIFKKAVKLLEMDQDKRSNEEAELDTYMDALQ
ncbi:DUF2312 domain-containing protein [Pseudosulfitobacter pseudonitzschiae]|uniref:DUF2312 domain-containing protein n=1 Tax=Pseudosulfitobacter pseudonitzschiae TaxID=1402135 RepID=UPI003B7DE8E0